MDNNENIDVQKYINDIEYRNMSLSYENLKTYEQILSKIDIYETLIQDLNDLKEHIKVYKKETISDKSLNTLYSLIEETFEKDSLFDEEKDNIIENIKILLFGSMIQDKQNQIKVIKKQISSIEDSIIELYYNN